jgi:hypothetical protein
MNERKEVSDDGDIHVRKVRLHQGGPLRRRPAEAGGAAGAMTKKG